MVGLNLLWIILDTAPVRRPWPWKPWLEKDEGGTNKIRLEYYEKPMTSKIVKEVTV